MTLEELTELTDAKLKLHEYEQELAAHIVKFFRARPPIAENVAVGSVQGMLAMIREKHLKPDSDLVDVLPRWMCAIVIGVLTNLLDEGHLQHSPGKPVFEPKLPEVN